MAIKNEDSGKQSQRHNDELIGQHDGPDISPEVA